MNSKADTRNMNQAKKRELKPKLRFPEFWDAGEWEENLIGDLLTIGNGKDYKHLSKGDIPVYGTGGYMLSVNDYLYDGESVCIGRKGTIDKPVLLSGKFWTVDTLFYTHSFKDCLPKFIHLCFQNIKWADYNAASGVPSLSKATIDKIEILVPSVVEQKKIADCLTSIDDRITAETQKLSTLKVHKKGLMQQLFPAEGETVPDRRFPEFRDTGEWEEYHFGKLIKVNSGKGFKASEYCKSGIRLVQIENVGYGVIKWSDSTVYLPQNYLIEYPELVLREGHIVLALNRPITNNELKIAQIQKEDGPSLLYQRVGKLELLSDSIVEDFVFHTCRKFIKNFVIKQSIGSDQPFISVTTLYAQVILIPSPDEQQKIADCLSSLDELTNAQIQKIDTLKTHKKGLMQQLFPAVEDAIE
jgi:type I restriction enzyme S subunit